MTFDPQTLPHHWINRLSFLLRRELHARFQRIGHNVTAEEWAVLTFLWKQDGRFAGELARLSVRDATTMTRMLDSMARKGLIRREADPSDRRRMRVCLSEKGQDIRPALVAEAEKLIAGSLNGIDGDDLETTLRTLVKIYENLEGKGA